MDQQMRDVSSETQMNGRSLGSEKGAQAMRDLNSEWMLQDTKKRAMLLKKLTLQEFLDEWLSMVRENTKPNTYCTYYRHMRNHISKNRLAEIRLREIQSNDIQTFVNGLEGVDGSKLSGKTVRLIYDMLKNALNCAVDYGWIENNPCFKIRLPRHEQKEIRIISICEQERLEKEIRSSKNNKAIGVLVSLYTGLRLGEVCALKWNDIDFYNGEMYVRRTMSRVALYDGKNENKTVIVEDSPKTRKSKRVIHLPEFLTKELAKRYARSNSEYVVSMRDGRCAHPRTMQDVFKSLIRASGLEHTNFHALRHTFATRAIELNINICAVSEILGHSNISMTVNRYIHALKEQKLDAAKNFDKFHNGRDTKPKRIYKK